MDIFQYLYALKLVFNLNEMKLQIECDDKSVYIDTSSRTRKDPVSRTMNTPIFWKAQFFYRLSNLPPFFYFQGLGITFMIEANQPFLKHIPRYQ